MNNELLNLAQRYLDGLNIKDVLAINMSQDTTKEGATSVIINVVTRERQVPESYYE